MILEMLSLGDLPSKIRIEKVLIFIYYYIEVNIKIIMKIIKSNKANFRKNTLILKNTITKKKITAYMSTKYKSLNYQSPELDILLQLVCE